MKLLRASISCSTDPDGVLFADLIVFVTLQKAQVCITKVCGFFQKTNEWMMPATLHVVLGGTFRGLK